MHVSIFLMYVSLLNKDEGSTHCEGHCIHIIMTIIVLCTSSVLINICTVPSFEERGLLPATSV